ncbi:GNAT family N-acetyltransferase [uncultured Roseibium sp.]|uniref:GNAT family N-acetyltransferase n=1 Tax=uncultured Roseibium sp. TaxID=1936171 RepID=UPI002637072A|nr:GNAT family N-acetyltransferase [uncultured Roseibium sp.]
MPLKLRPATLADAPALTRILHRAKASWGYPQDKMDAFCEAWGVEEATIRSLEITVADRDGKPLAFSGVTAQDGDTLLVDFLFVDPVAQGSGLGSLLLKRAEDVARQKGLRRLYLESDFHAEQFYLKHGYRTLDTRSSEMSPGKDIPLMEKWLPASVHKVTNISLRLTEKPWWFETENELEISAHFEEAKKRIALLWNGRTLKLTAFEFKNGTFTGRCSESSYAAHLAWRDWGAPDATAFNLFGSAIVRSLDGALLYGVMADHTATAGMIYPPGGNLDLNDVTPENEVDIHAAIRRELQEETGLICDRQSGEELLVAFDGPRISIAQIFDIDETAESLRMRMIEHSLKSEEQELADIFVIRTRSDLDNPAIVPFAREIAEYLLPSERLGNTRAGQ